MLQVMELSSSEKAKKENSLSTLEGIFFSELMVQNDLVGQNMIQSDCQPSSPPPPTLDHKFSCNFLTHYLAIVVAKQLHVTIFGIEN